MAATRTEHRRSFRKATALTIVAAVAILAVVVAAILLVLPRVASDGVLGWATRLAIIAFAILATLVGAYVALAAVGGVVVLHRDACEDRGVPYTPARPRERVIGPAHAAIRRFVRPGASLRPGELVEVRGLDEILATLDDRGCLDGMPFMPEMAAFCGHRFRVQRRVDKVWEYAHGTGLRRVDRAVLLETLRCAGTSHGGCQSSCQLIWKESWLRRPSAEPTPAPGLERSLDLQATSSVTVDGERRYVCQMTEIIRSSEQLPPRNSRHYWRDLASGNVRLGPLLVVLGVRAFNGVQWRLKGARWPVLTPMDSPSSPHADLGLQPGQLVRVKPKRAIESTLNRQLRNRGLEFGNDMLFCCGGSYRVAARVDRILHEGTGQLLELSTPSILLEGANANGGTVLTPQNEFFFWREIWLEPDPSSEEQERSR